MDNDRSPGTLAPRAPDHSRRVSRVSQVSRVSRVSRGGVVAVVAVGALVLAGCGVRVETPPPDPPQPGPVEVVRQSTAVGSASIAQDAGRASLDTLDERLFAVLERVRLDAETHVEALGGVYSVDEGGVVETAPGDEFEGDGADDDGDGDGDGESGDGNAGAGEAGDDTAVDDTAVDDGADGDGADGDADEPAPEPVDPADLALTLTTEAGAARGAADRVDDGGLARLLTVIATSRLLAADALARNLDVERPRLGSDALPTALPNGPSATEIAAVVVAEDQAGFAFEMIAARSSEQLRDRARAAARHHRATADAWARLAGMTEPGLDPRAVSYALDGSLETPESRDDLAVRLETALLTAYASLVALAAPGERAELAELHTLAADAVRRWGGAPGALPGLPVDPASD